MTSSDSPRVSFLGPEATYTHQALIQQFGQEANIIAEKSINDCFKRLDKDEVDYAVVPFENSTNGQVTFTYDLLRDWLIPAHENPTPSEIKVVAEQFVNIHHCVLSHATDISQVEKIYSHPQAWGQVTKWMNDTGASLEKIDSSSTSRAAEIASLSGAKFAAVASEYASIKHNIPILYKNIENVKDNTTRFLILSKKQPKFIEGKQYITLLAFTVEHNDSGALVRALSVLSKYGINMTSITSRPSLIKPWQYVFFIEFWGHATNDSKVVSAIKEIDNECLTAVTIGTFPRSERYFGPTE